MDEEEAFKDAIERYNSIEIIHDAGQDSVEIPNMRPEKKGRNWKTSSQKYVQPECEARN